MSIPDAFVEILPKLHRVGAVVRLDAGADGAFTFDARESTAKLVDDGSVEPDCTISGSLDNLVKLVTGDMDPMLAYTLGRIKVSGAMDVAMRLVKAIGA